MRTVKQYYKFNGNTKSTCDNLHMLKSFVGWIPEVIVTLNELGNRLKGLLYLTMNSLFKKISTCIRLYDNLAQYDLIFVLFHVFSLQ